MYYDYYEMIHENKDSLLDVALMVNFLKKNLGCLSRVLEVGCGTGRHTAQLASHFSSVYAIDKDEQMILQAKNLIQKENVSLFHSSAAEILNLKVPLFSSVCSFFNVINYLTHLHDLQQFFKAIALSMESLGFLFFDCLDWEYEYQPVFSSKRLYKKDETSFYREIHSTYDPKEKVLKVTEEYENPVFHSRSVFQHVYRIWSKEQLLPIFKEVGLELVSCQKKHLLRAGYQKKNQVLFTMQKRAH